MMYSYQQNLTVYSDKEEEKMFHVDKCKDGKKQRVKDVLFSECLLYLSNHCPRCKPPFRKLQANGSKHTRPSVGSWSKSSVVLE